MEEAAATLRSWFTDLVLAWRQAWETAPEPIRACVATSLCYLGAPVQGWIYVRRDRVTSIEATLILLRRDGARPDGETMALFVEDDGAIQGDAPKVDWILNRLERSWSNMRANWTPGRPADPPPEPREFLQQRMDREIPMTVWEVPGNLAGVDIQKLVGHIFREEQEPGAAPPSRKEEPHIFELREEREPVAVDRWLNLNASQLFRALGLSDFWWCALRLPRKDVFADTRDGDIDILAGPLEFDMREEEWRTRIDGESQRRPLSTAHSNIETFAVLRATAEGLIQWPPNLDTLVACEAKASWFRPDAQQWKATHAGEAARVKGQLKRLLQEGFDRVGFLHIGATQPRDVGIINPWLQSAADATDGEDKLMPIYAPADMPLCGYFTTVLGAVPFAAEHMSGAGSALRVRQACLPNPAPTQQWREQLRQRLAQLPKPTSPTTFILSCPDCGRWNMRSRPVDLTCTCS